jgi:hypothetical protein
MREHLTNFARECDMYGLSDRSGVAVASGLLQDLEIVTEASSSKVIDRSKLPRLRKNTESASFNKIYVKVFNLFTLMAQKTPQEL